MASVKTAKKPMVSTNVSTRIIRYMMRLNFDLKNDKFTLDNVELNEKLSMESVQHYQGKR